MQRVSVIIPTYQRPQRVINAVQSVLQQTYPHVEIIVVDDNHEGSHYRKETEKLVAPFIAQGVKYIAHKENRNGAAARNTGISNATGEFICFLDDDDSYFPEKIVKQVNYLNQHSQHHAVCCASRFKNSISMPDLSGNLTAGLLQSKTFLFTPALMFRAEAVKRLNGFDERFVRHQDVEFMLRYLRHYSIGGINDVLVDVGQNKGENTLKAGALENCKRLLLDTFKTDIAQFGARFRNKIYTIHYAHVFISYVKVLQWKNAARVARQYLLRSPFHFFSALALRFKQYARYRIANQNNRVC